MKSCYQSDYSNEKITWLEKEGATQLKIIMHSGADHNGDFGKITEKYNSAANSALFNSKILISSPAWSNDYNLVPDSMMKSANKLTQYGSRAPSKPRPKYNSHILAKNPKFLALYGSNLDPEE